MKKFLFCIAAALTCLAAGNNLSAVSLDVGELFMPPDTQREFTLSLSGDAEIEGLNFVMQVGDGIEGPTVSNLDIVFAGSVFGANNLGQFFDGDSRTVLASTVTESGTVPISGKPIVRFTLDSTGLLAGSQYSLKVKDIIVADMTWETDLAGFPLDLTNGWITIEASNLVTWTKGADGLWNEPGSWSGGIVPRSTDEVAISGAVSVTDTSAVTEVKSLQVGNGASLTCNSLIADTLSIGSGNAAAVPEPGTLSLLAAGLAAMLAGFARTIIGRNFTFGKKN
jgi:hypothetical protein